MTILLFIIILGALVFVHELGHFLVAKLSGTRVDEFGLGFPPRIASVTYGETRYSLNLVPFGGFVKIYGENPEEVEEGLDVGRSFTDRSKWWQAAILVAGVTFNMIFAWILISAGFMIGQPTPLAYDGPGQVVNPELVILGTFPDSPAQDAGLQAGDVITGVSAGEQALSEISDDTVSAFINEQQDELVVIEYYRGEELLSAELTPVSGLVEGKKAVGVSFDMIGTLQLGPIAALSEGFSTTINLTKTIFTELSKFFGSIFIGEGDLSQVTGPVGIVGLVGDASRLGFVHILSFTAIISIHLAIINMIPFPALDGGRLLFVVIEAIIRRPVPMKIFQYTNAIGFFLLIGLMIVVTFSDIAKLL